MKLLFIILGILIAVTAMIIAITCCKAAKQADEANERLFREYLLKQRAQEPPAT